MTPVCVESGQQKKRTSDLLNDFCSNALKKNYKSKIKMTNNKRGELITQFVREKFSFPIPLTKSMRLNLLQISPQKKYCCAFPADNEIFTQKKRKREERVESFCSLHVEISRVE